MVRSECSSWSDEDLASAIAERNAGSLRELFERHEPWLSVRLSYRCSDGSTEMPSAEDELLVAVEHGGLGDALGRLSPKLRAVVQSTVLDGLTCREAGRLMGVPRSDLAGIRPVRQEELWDRILDRIDVPRRPLRWSTTALKVLSSSPRMLAVTATLSVGLLIAMTTSAMVSDGWAARMLLSGAQIALPVWSIA